MSPSASRPPSRAPRSRSSSMAALRCATSLGSDHMNRNHEPFTAIRRRLAAERGFTLIEILIAMALVSIGVAATIGVFGSSSRATVRAQRGEVAVQQAQAEIDRLTTLEYGETALTSTPTAS